MTNNQLTREENVQAVFDLKAGYTLGLADVEILKRVARMALAAMDSEPVEMPLDYLQGHKDGLEWAAQLAEANHPETGDWLYDDPIELAKAIRKGPDMPPAQPAPVVPDENVSFHRLPGESEYDRLNRQREWMESKSKLAKVTAAAPDDLTERLLRLRAQATLDGSYLDTEEWDSLACDVIKALNACRSAMLQGRQKSAGASNNGRSGENVQVMQDVSRCSTKAAPVLDSSPKTAESRCSKSPMWIGVDWAKGFEPGNSPVIPAGYVMVPKEPTEAMMLHNSGCQHHAWDDPDCAMRQTRRLVWSHMLAAAPQEVR